MSIFNKYMALNIFIDNNFYIDEFCTNKYNGHTSLPKIPEVIDMVVSPKRAKAVIEEAAKLGVKYIWFQPGTYDDETLEMAKGLGLETTQACVLVATR